MNALFVKVYSNRFVLTPGLAWWPRVAGAAAEGRLEVIDGLLKDLPFPTLEAARTQCHKHM